MIARASLTGFLWMLMLGFIITAFVIRGISAWIVVVPATAIMLATMGMLWNWGRGFNEYRPASRNRARHADEDLVERLRDLLDEPVVYEDARTRIDERQRYSLGADGELRARR